ncbi:MAG: hypothetical protein BMS9Abin10_0808 [Gammaproteobacteria bacterium]|nr:MAG: hypothetical protein BMS9Abin10_0808 [Gammaproteobacteria bacterium]
MATIHDIRISADSSCRSGNEQVMCSGCPAMFFADNGAGDRKSDYICRTIHGLFDSLKNTVSDMLETSA